MSCSKKVECERMKDLSHASVLISQEANLTNKHLAVVRKQHRDYGEYYGGMKYEEAKSLKLKIYADFKPGQSMKKKPKKRVKSSGEHK